MSCLHSNKRHLYQLTLSLLNRMFYKGIHSAINVGLSVSRVGSAAQTRAMKQVVVPWNWSCPESWGCCFCPVRFWPWCCYSTTLEVGGVCLTELLKQGQYSPHGYWRASGCYLCGARGIFDKLEPSKITKLTECFSLLMLSSCWANQTNGKFSEETDAKLKEINELLAGFEA